MNKKQNNLSRYWPFVSILAFVALVVVLVASSTPAQAYTGDLNAAFQDTPPPATVPAATVIVPTVIIPDTGGDTIFVDFFSSWVLWTVFGLLVIVLLVALAARPRGPVDPDIHHHHDV